MPNKETVITRDGHPFDRNISGRLQAIHQLWAIITWTSQDPMNNDTCDNRTERTTQLSKLVLLGGYPGIHAVPIRTMHWNQFNRIYIECPLNLWQTSFHHVHHIYVFEERNV